VFVYIQTLAIFPSTYNVLNYEKGRKSVVYSQQHIQMENLFLEWSWYICPGADLEFGKRGRGVQSLIIIGP